MDRLLFNWLWAFSATFKKKFFSAKLATLSSKSKDWLAQNQDKVLKEIFFKSMCKYKTFIHFLVLNSQNENNY
jgi:hypothetical protein